MKNKDTMKKKFILCLAMLMVCVVGMARISENLLPKPQQMITMGGSFQMGKVVLSTPVLQTEWEEFVTQAGGTIVDKSARKIEVKLVPEVQGAKFNQKEAYCLKVTAKGVEVEATTPKGVYWALQTLRQLEEKKGRFETCEIVDWPAFKIRGFTVLRGLHELLLYVIGEL